MFFVKIKFFHLNFCLNYRSLEFKILINYLNFHFLESVIIIFILHHLAIL